MNKIIITTGDIDGIGYEVTAKSLTSFSGNHQFIVWRSPQALSKYTQLIQSLPSYSVSDSLDSALQSPANITEIVSSSSPAQWVEESAKACYEGAAKAMVTGPLSKTEILRSGRQDMGHTDILKRVSGATTVHMGFFGKHFNVVLATGHIPLSKVSQTLNKSCLEEAIANSSVFLKRLSLNTEPKPIGILGLNPHAGEEGLIGSEETLLFADIDELAKKYKVNLVGPLVPDAAFLKDQWDRFSIYIALYHDQGLIPFKCVHGQDSGAHITLGIPFIRTSVDHGTAKDIFNLDKANPQSMIDAIRWAIRLS